MLAATHIEEPPRETFVSRNDSLVNIMCVVANIMHGAAIILHGPAIILRSMTSIWSNVADISHVKHQFLFWDF